jgi:hypothetical protein
MTDGKISRRGARAACASARPAGKLADRAAPLAPRAGPTLERHSCTTRRTSPAHGDAELVVGTLVAGARNRRQLFLAPTDTVGAARGPTAARRRMAALATAA